MTACVLFFAAVILFYRWLGPPAITFGIIPLLIGAWMYGAWAGLLFAIILYVVGFAMVILLGWENIHVVVHPGALSGLVVSAAAGLIVGRMRDTSKKDQDEVEQHVSQLEERDAHSQFWSSLNETLLAAGEAEDLPSMLKVLAERLAGLFGSDRCYITFWDERQRKVNPMAAHGPASEAFFTNVRRLSASDLTLTSAVLDTGHAIILEDVQHSNQFSPTVADGYPSQSLLVLPLTKGEQKLGAIILGYAERHCFAKEEIEHGEMAARQASMTVAKALSLEEARQRVHELAGINIISQAFSLHGDPRRTFGLLTKTLAELMNVKMCLIGLYNPLTHRLHLQTPAYGLGSKLVASLRYSTEAQTEIPEDAKPGTFRANSEAEFPAEYLPLARSLDVDCALVAPLFDAGERLLGAIFVANKPGGFDDNDARLLEVFAQQVTAVVQNARLLYAERTRAEQLTVLQSIAIAVAEVDNEDQLIENVTLIIGQKFSASSFGVLLLDEAAHELFPHSTYRIGPHEGLKRVPLGVGVVGTVAGSGTARRINDASVSPEQLSLSPEARSELCVPLKAEETLLGVVNIESTKAGVYTAEDEELLTLIAGQLGTAIQRLRTAAAQAHQAEQLERSNSLIRALAQVSAHAAGASDQRGVLQALANELPKLGLCSVIALSDASGQLVVFRHFSLPKQLAHSIERLGGKMQDYTVPIAKLPHYSDSSLIPGFVKDPLATLTSVAPELPQNVAVKVLRQIGVNETTLVCQLPLITEGKSTGVMWLWGGVLRESDLGAATLFASQIAAALQNAILLSEVGRLAITDELTEIFNRRHFFEVAEEKFAQAKRSGNPLSVLVVDLDHFKKVNDRYGHGVGDQVLREVAGLMSAAMREHDVIGRYGGEEFSIVLPNTTPQAAINVAERLLSSVSGVPVDTEAGKLSVQLSIGVAGISEETATLHTLIMRADQAMYLAKRAGRNCVAVK